MSRRKRRLPSTRVWQRRGRRRSVAAGLRRGSRRSRRRKRRWRRLFEAPRLDSSEEHVEGDAAQLPVVGELPGRARIDGISPATVSVDSAC